MKFITNGDALIVLDFILAVWLLGSVIQHYSYTSWGPWGWVLYTAILTSSAVVFVIWMLFCAFKQQLGDEYPYKIKYK